MRRIEGDDEELGYAQSIYRVCTLCKVDLKVWLGHYLLLTILIWLANVLVFYMCYPLTCSYLDKLIYYQSENQRYSTTSHLVLDDRPQTT